MNEGLRRVVRFGFGVETGGLVVRDPEQQHEEADRREDQHDLVPAPLVRDDHEARLRTRPRWPPNEGRPLASPLVRPSRLWSLLLLPGGLAAGHALGYAGARLVGSTPTISGEHSYLGALLCLGIPFSLAVIARAVVAGTRTERAPIRFSTLAVAQVLCFAVIEVAEHASVGIDPAAAVREMSFVLGVLAQLAVAWLVCAVVRVANRVAAKVARRRATVPSRRAQPALVADLCVARFSVAMSSLSRRGPPSSFLPIPS